MRKHISDCLCNRAHSTTASRSTLVRGGDNLQATTGSSLSWPPGLALRLSRPTDLHPVSRHGTHESAARVGKREDVRWLCHFDLRRRLGHRRADLRVRRRSDWPSENVDDYRAAAFRFHGADSIVNLLDRLCYVPLHHGIGRRRCLWTGRGADCRYCSRHGCAVQAPVFVTTLVAFWPRPDRSRWACCNRNWVKRQSPDFRKWQTQRQGQPHACPPFATQQAGSVWCLLPALLLCTSCLRRKDNRCQKMSNSS